jgi:hypothetical protein
MLPAILAAMGSESMTNSAAPSLPRLTGRLTGPGWLYAISIAAILAAAAGAFVKFDASADEAYVVQQDADSRR